MRADLAGTGVVVTQVCPGPVDSDLDTVAGTAGGMTGGPPQFLRISAARCAREALAGFEAGKPLVFPGRAYRTGMRALPLLPRSLQRRPAASSAARLRSQAPHAVAGPGYSVSNRSGTPAANDASRRSSPTSSVTHSRAIVSRVPNHCATDTVFPVAAPRMPQPTAAVARPRCGDSQEGGRRDVQNSPICARTLATSPTAALAQIGGDARVATRSADYALRRAAGPKRRDAGAPRRPRQNVRS